jgi:uncharacterized DUF497 family protein
MSSPLIEEFLFDELNEAKINSHGLSIHQVAQVLENTHVIIHNRKQRRGLYLLIGKDRGGNCISIPIEKTYHPKLWRPITAWFSKNSERTLIEKRER